VLGVIVIGRGDADPARPADLPAGRRRSDAGVLAAVALAFYSFVGF
jgi:hypothetical protein